MMSSITISDASAVSASTQRRCDVVGVRVTVIAIVRFLQGPAVLEVCTDGLAKTHWSLSLKPRQVGLAVGRLRSSSARVRAGSPLADNRRQATPTQRGACGR